MATKNYMINDKWLDLDKQNIVELQSVDGELDSLKVNGSEIVTPSGKITITENGTDIDIAQYATADVNVEGGSSDFSTAEVTITNSIPDLYAVVRTPFVDEGSETPFVVPASSQFETAVEYEESVTIQVIMYKGLAHLLLIDSDSGDYLSGFPVTGDIHAEADYEVRGNGTISLSTP